MAVVAMARCAANDVAGGVRANVGMGKGNVANLTAISALANVLG